MSKYYVKTRTPSQIASHAQKFNKRQKNTDTKRRRSINDITLPDLPSQLSKIHIPRVSCKVEQALPTSSCIRQEAPSLGSRLPQQSPNPNPNWVVAGGSSYPRPDNFGCNFAVGEARPLYLPRQQTISSNYIQTPVLSRLPQPNPRVPYSMNPPETPAYFSAETIRRSYGVNQPMDMFMNTIELVLQQSPRLDNNAVATSQLRPFQMGYSHLPNAEFYGGRFYP